jgi:hypothetical protein
MTYTVLNQNTGDAFSIDFDNEEHKQQWLINSPGFKCLGEQEYTLPTRHVRMQNKEEFAGWGS